MISYKISVLSLGKLQGFWPTQAYICLVGEPNLSYPSISPMAQKIIILYVIINKLWSYYLLY